MDCCRGDIEGDLHPKGPLKAQPGSGFGVHLRQGASSSSAADSSQRLAESCSSADGRV